MAEETRVHLIRHGEVHNPDGILYGRLPGFRLSDTGRAQAVAAADLLAGRDIVAVIASPLQRAQRPPPRSPPGTTWPSTPTMT